MTIGKNGRVLAFDLDDETVNNYHGTCPWCKRTVTVIEVDGVDVVGNIYNRRGAEHDCLHVWNENGFSDWADEIEGIV